MATFRHQDGRVQRAAEGSKRYRIFERSTQWERIEEGGSLEHLNKGELESIAVERGVDPTDKTKAELIEELESE